MGTITNLRGRTFGRIYIPSRAEPEIRGGSAYWPCVCECTPHIKRWIRGKSLLAGRTVSCGCAKRDPEVRRAARMVTPAKRRREIAKMGQAARARRPEGLS